jgi:hypothetical protein
LVEIMAGTKQGGLNAAATNKAKFGDDYYVKLGAVGGKVKGQPKGFAAMDKDKVRAAGAKGGKISRRPKI